MGRSSEHDSMQHSSFLRLPWLSRIDLDHTCGTTTCFVKALTWINARDRQASFNTARQQYRLDLDPDGVVMTARLARPHVHDPHAGVDPCSTCEARALSVCNAIPDADLARLSAIAAVTEVIGGARLHRRGRAGHLLLQRHRRHRQAVQDCCPTDGGRSPGSSAPASFSASRSPIPTPSAPRRSTRCAFAGSHGPRCAPCWMTSRRWRSACSRSPPTSWWRRRNRCCCWDARRRASGWRRSCWRRAARECHAATHASGSGCR